MVYWLEKLLFCKFGVLSLNLYFRGTVEVWKDYKTQYKTVSAELDFLCLIIADKLKYSEKI